MLSQSLLVLASAALALASPCAKSTPTLPVNGDASELPAPPAGATLKHIALGFGLQNYSCSAAGATPASTGALAVLYDITNLYPDDRRRGALTQAVWTDLTAAVVEHLSVPINLATPGQDSSGAVVSSPFPAPAALGLDGLSLHFLGHHFFNANSTPVFDISTKGELLVATKKKAVDAPSSADKGPDGTGAVAWLFLQDNGSSSGLKYVYRVLTAGGNSHGCTQAGHDSTSYSAQYWFYT